MVRYSRPRSLVILLLCLYPVWLQHTSEVSISGDLYCPSVPVYTHKRIKNYQCNLNNINLPLTKKCYTKINLKKSGWNFLKNQNTCTCILFG